MGEEEEPSLWSNYSQEEVICDCLAGGDAAFAKDACQNLGKQWTGMYLMEDPGSSHKSQDLQRRASGHPWTWQTQLAGTRVGNKTPAGQEHRQRQLWGWQAIGGPLLVSTSQAALPAPLQFWEVGQKG